MRLPAIRLSRNVVTMPYHMLPHWWTSSAVYEFLSGPGMHYWIAHWNHFFAAIVVVASTRGLKCVPRTWPVRPVVLMWTLLAVQFIFGFLGFSTLDGGMAYYGGSALWAVIAVWYAAFIWALRRQALREQQKQHPAAPAA